MFSIFIYLFIIYLLFVYFVLFHDQLAVMRASNTKHQKDINGTKY